MKVEKYAVSVMWGSAFHHFQCYTPTQEEAKALASTLQENLNRLRNAKEKRSRGAKPRTFVWVLAAAYDQ